MTLASVNSKRPVSAACFVAWVILAPLAVAQEKPIVKVEAARNGHLERTVRQSAVLSPYEMVTVHAKVSGYVGKVHVDIGDKVRKGQVLLELEIPEMVAELAAAQAAVRTADAEVEKARAGVTLKKVLFEQIRDLFEKRGRTQFQLDEARAELDLAAAQEKLTVARKEQVEAHVEELGVLEQYARVVAPFDGSISSRHVDTGALVHAGTSDPTALFKVYRADRLRCRVHISERDVYLVLQSHAGKTISATLDVHALPGRKIEFTSDALHESSLRFSGMLHEESHHMLMELLIPNEDELLLPGLFGTITIRARGFATGEAVLVPNPAIRAPRKESEIFVFVVKGESGAARVERRPVKLGATDGSFYEILGGLADGEQVVVRGAGVLVDGQEVVVGSQDREEP